jgi:hypothetical protein
MKTVITLISILITNLLFSQPNEYSTQLIGVNAYIKFPAGISLPGAQIFTSEGCASICDAAGNLLFYSDGIKVWNRNHIQMPNGFGLAGDVSSSQSCIIVKLPNSSNIYYLFTAPETSSSFTQVTYNIIDMNANGGFGDVTSKNQNLPITYQSAEKLTFTYHCNRRDIWIVTKDRSNNVFRAWLLTPTGLTAWTFSLTGYNLTNNISDNIGCMKISSDGSKLVICHYGTNRVYLYDFNNQTGVIDNERLLSSTFVGPYGCEFSENSRYVYIGYNNGLNIHSYDTNNANPASTRVTLAVNVGLFVGSFQRIGSIIYIAQRGTTFLDAITNANTGGTFNQNYLATTNTINFGLNQVLYPDLTPPPIIMTD